MSKTNCHKMTYGRAATKKNWIDEIENKKMESLLLLLWTTFKKNQKAGDNLKRKQSNN